MEAGILLASSPRAAKPPTLVVQPDNGLVCARKLSAVVGGGCSPQGLCLAPSPQRGIPALMQHRGALDAIGPQHLQGEGRPPPFDALQCSGLMKGRHTALQCVRGLQHGVSVLVWKPCAWQQVLILALRGLGGTCCIKPASVGATL